jgi:hypothetical protein
MKRPAIASSKESKRSKEREAQCRLKKEGGDAFRLHWQVTLREFLRPLCQFVSIYVYSLNFIDIL